MSVATAHQPETRAAEVTRPCIGIFLPALSGGGAERAMLHLSEGLADRGFTVHMVLSRKEGPYLKLVSPRVQVIDLSADGPISRVRHLARYVKQHRPDGLIAALDQINAAGAARRLAGVKTPVVQSLQNHVSQDVGSDGGWRGRFRPAVMRRAYRGCDAIVAVSQGVADDFLQWSGWTDSRHPPVKVVHNPIAHPRVFEQAREGAEHPFFDSGLPVLLGVGRLEPQKDFPTLLRAFALMKKRLPARLIILGEGSQRDQLHGLITQLGLTEDVALPGFADNPYAFMARSTLFVLSSRWEGLPSVLIEALASGAAIVSTDCPSGAREILEDGRFGTLCPVGQVEPMAAAIETALLTTPDREALRARARLYSVDAAVDGFLDLLGLNQPARAPRGEA